MRVAKRVLSTSLVGWVVVLFLGLPVSAAPSGPPIRIGSTLSLTGPVASSAVIHKIAGEIYVEQLNQKNGLLGRPVEWVLLDDQSKPDLARSLYERLVTVQKVDLVIGAHGTAANLSAIAVAQRYEKFLLSNTMGVPRLSTYDLHFPTQAIGPEPDKTFPGTVFGALAATGKPPTTLAIVTSKFPSVHFISIGAREVAAKHGLNVGLFLEYEFGTRDFVPLAARIKATNPDFLWVGAFGLDGNMLLEALKKLEYRLRGHFYLFPSPGPMVQAPEANYALALEVCRTMDLVGKKRANAVALDRGPDLLSQGDLVGGLLTATHKNEPSGHGDGLLPGLSEG